MKKRLFIISFAFCISFISMVALSLFSINRFRAFSNYSVLADHANNGLEKILKTELHLYNIDRAERGYMLTRDTMYMRYIRNSIDSAYTSIEHLKQVLSDNGTQPKNIESLKTSLEHKVEALNKNINFVDTADNSIPSQYFYSSRKQSQECSLIVNKLLEAERKYIATIIHQEQTYQHLAGDTLKYLLFIFCIITLVVFMLLIKELQGRMNFQYELQARVSDLKRSHAELQEIAYAASHDLQEPLRKIQVFSSMLLMKNSHLIDNESKSVINRIYTSAERMQTLIGDLVNLTSLTKIDENKNKVDLNRVLKFILIDIDLALSEKKAKIELAILPEIMAYEAQLKILFRALIDNSLKFTREGVAPIITFTYEICSGSDLKEINQNLKDKKFHCVTISDNGIGFDNKYLDKMFGIFQRLHNQQSEFEGKGIGLAICQRIMANHEGYIIGNGVPHEGATFKFYFPLGKS